MSPAQHLRQIAAAARRELRRRPALHRPLRRAVILAMRVRPVAELVTRLLEPHRRATILAYPQWVRENDTITEADRAAIRAAIPGLARKPLISVVMPAYNTDPALLRAAVASVQRQLYPHWELCVADDASPDGRAWALLQELAAADKRIKVMRREQNGHISAATNSALALATGEFVALMDHDDLLPEHALFEVAAEISAYPDADMIYSDEDKIDGRGRRSAPYFKPDFNAELLLGQNFISHLGVYRRSLLEEIGGLRVGFEGSQDYDLALRATERTTPERIRHIPAVLYHWRQGASEQSFSESALARCADSARRAVAEHLRRTGVGDAVVGNLEDMPAWVEVRRPLPAPLPLVSAIIPTRDRAGLLRTCVEGLLHRTDYPALEVIIVDNGSEEAETLALFRELSADARVRVLRIEGPFNYAALNNQAAAEARGEILLLLNNDIEVIEPGWLKAMVAHAVRPEIGAVGARLLYADGRVQHAGVILGVGGDPAVAGHLHSTALRSDPGYFGHLRLAREASAVTAACMALRRSVFEEAGGFDQEKLKVAFNDVDLCLKIRALGYRIVWTPLAELYHLESVSRGSDLRPETIERFKREIAVMRERWGPVLDNDPFYGPNFARMGGHYELAARTRRVRPWQAGHTAAGTG
ncbi:glycosyltransferase family 2 protein [Roseomonas elaeocarpi]|uniref:Glycosyltransferase n=1 Tax=Roseomonas elaeocarpi TaxID=907779 RepID=A0ABV6JTK6_9PROT